MSVKVKDLVDRVGEWDARERFDARTSRIFFRSFLFSLFHHPFDVHFRTPNGVPVWTSIGEDISTSKTIKNDVRLGCPAQTKRATLKRPMDVQYPALKSEHLGLFLYLKKCFCISFLNSKKWNF
jgi:hypothetical protein